MDKASSGKILLLLLSSALVSGGCASYTSRMAAARADFVAGDYQAALGEIDESDCESGGDQVLVLLERATIKQLAGDYAGSNEDFERVYRLVREYERRAAVSVRDTANEAGAALTNETVLPYKGKGYELILLHCYKALNFLMLGDVEGARVERQRLENRRKEEIRRHGEQMEEARKLAQENQVSENDLEGVEGQLLSQYGQGARDRAASVANLYLSAFGSYISSIIYDVEGDFSDAALDCRRVLEQYPDFEYARRDAATYAAAGIRYSGENLDLAGKGDLAVFAQLGLAPVKREISLAFPIDDAWISLAFPVYDTMPTDLGSIRVLVGSEPVGETLDLDDVEAKAIRTLIDDIPVMVARQVVRAVLKGVAAHAANEADPWLGLLVNIYNIASEQADLRSWLLLPQTIQALRAYPAEGPAAVTIQALSRSGEVLGESRHEFEFAGNRLNVVLVRAIGYTPEIPGGLTLTVQWLSLPRVPLISRPRPRLP